MRVYHTEDKTGGMGYTICAICQASKNVTDLFPRQRS
jgi:hypothetical protein